jgi:predicted MFS family arabinose efflux permease
MQKLLLVLLLAATLLAPAVAFAQPVPPAAPAPDTRTHVYVIRPVQVLAVGAGAVAGAMVLEALGAADVGYLVGAVVGGYLAAIWYDDLKFEIHTGAPPKI